jgi:hypothetical protein
MKYNKYCGTYITGDVSKCFIGRKSMQDVDDRFEPLEQFVIALPKFAKRIGLFLEYGNNRPRVVATIDLGSECVVAEIFASLLGILRQGGIENCLEVRGNGGCIRSRGHGDKGYVDVVEGSLVPIRLQHLSLSRSHVGV